MEKRTKKEMGTRPRRRHMKIGSSCKRDYYNAEARSRNETMMKAFQPSTHQLSQNFKIRHVSMLKVNRYNYKLMNIRSKRPTVAEVLADPLYEQTLFKLTPTKSGKLPVAKGRGGPIDIEWEVHGHGDIKLVVCHRRSGNLDRRSRVKT